MGFPASGVEGYFRNHIDDIAQYLKWRHNDKFLVLSTQLPFSNTIEGT